MNVGGNKPLPRVFYAEKCSLRTRQGGQPLPSVSFFSEADYLPGLVVDVYGTMLRIIISSRVAHHFQDLIVETLESLLKPTLIILNTDSAFAAAEHLKETLLYYQDGQYFSPSKKLDPVRFREDNLYYEVAPGKGQKKRILL